MRREIHLQRFSQSRQISSLVRAATAQLIPHLHRLSELLMGDWSGLESRREQAEFAAQCQRRLQR